MVEKRHGHRTATGKAVLTELDIDMIVSEAIRVAGHRIEDIDGPLRGFEEAVEYAGDVVFEDRDKEYIRYQHVIEIMWGMPNWLCVIEQDCWDCFRETYHEMGNRTTMYIRREDRETIKIRIDGLYAVAFKRSGARGWSEKSEKEAFGNALKDMVEHAGREDSD